MWGCTTTRIAWSVSVVGGSTVARLLSLCTLGEASSPQLPGTSSIQSSPSPSPPHHALRTLGEGSAAPSSPWEGAEASWAPHSVPSRCRATASPDSEAEEEEEEEGDEGAEEEEEEESSSMLL